MIVFHDIPADTDPQKLKKEVKKSGAYCPPPFELPGGLGTNPEHVDPLHFVGGGKIRSMLTPFFQLITQDFGSLVVNQPLI